MPTVHELSSAISDADGAVLQRLDVTKDQHGAALFMAALATNMAALLTQFGISRQRAIEMLDVALNLSGDTVPQSDAERGSARRADGASVALDATGWATLIDDVLSRRLETLDRWRRVAARTDAGASGKSFEKWLEVEIARELQARGVGHIRTNGFLTNDAQGLVVAGPSPYTRPDRLPGAKDRAKHHYPDLSVSASPGHFVDVELKTQKCGIAEFRADIEIVKFRNANGVSGRRSFFIWAFLETPDHDGGWGAADRALDEAQASGHTVVRRAIAGSDWLRIAVLGPAAPRDSR